MRKLLIALVVLVLLLIGADFALRFVATSQIGDALKNRLGLTTSPDVSISGFPFVTQAINGEYDAISASLPAATFGPVSGVGVSVDLLGVRIPLSDALAGDVDRLTAAGSQVRISVPTASIAAAAGIPSLQVSQQGNTLTLGATLSLLGQNYPVTADLDASVVNSSLELRTGQVSGLGITIPAAALQTIGNLVDLTIPLTNLPFTITSGSVGVAGGDVVVDATTSTLDLANR